MKKYPIKTAVIGYGHLGRWHAEKTHRLAELTAIIETQPERKDLAQKIYPEVKVVDDLDEVIDEIDAAIIVTPTSTHFSYLKTLMEKAKHVFCEKPLVGTMEEAEMVKKISQSKGTIIQVGHSERFHESWEIIDRYKKYIEGEGVIRMNRFAPFKGRATDVDVVQDLMIHDLDLFQYIFKESPCSVRSTGYKIRSGRWDYVCSEFSFKSKKKAFIVASRNHVKEVRDLEVFSDHGCLYVDLLHNEIMVAPQDRTVTGEYIESFKVSQRDHLYIEQEHFFNSIHQEKEAIVSLDDGLQAVRLISKVLESLDLGKEVSIDL